MHDEIGAIIWFHDAELQFGFRELPATAVMRRKIKARTPMMKVNISQVDTIFANGGYPIEFLFYYRNRLESEKIRSALEKTSPIFWPIFGEYDSGTIYFDKYAGEEYFKEDGSNEKFDPGEAHKEIYTRFREATPSVLKKLFFLKLIQTRNGTVLIPKMNHLAGDGYSYFYFLSVLAALSRNGDDPALRDTVHRHFNPHHQRTILKDFYLGHITLAPVRNDDPRDIEVIEISKASVKDRIKEIASNSGQTVSPNDILSAMAIQKMAEIRAGNSGDDLRLTIPIDVRRKIKEYGPTYFGNGLMFNDVNFKTAEIEQSDTGTIAADIRKCMPVVNKETYIEYLDTLEARISRSPGDKLGPYDPEAGCLVTNLSQLPVNDLDFGTGPPDLLLPLTLGKNSAAIMADKDNFILRLVY